MLTDLHCHILPGIDDGAPDIDESIAMLVTYSELGFTDIVCTPHYIAGTPFSADNATKLRLVQTLQNECIKNNLKINLHIGNEAYVDANLLNQISRDQVSLIAKKFLLFELPFKNETLELDSLIAAIQAEDIYPIIAHPERYAYFQKQPQKMLALRKKGVRFQCNYGSILGIYGKLAKRTIIYCLKNDLVSFLGTDAHRSEFQVLTNLTDAMEDVVKIIGLEKYKKILANNNLLAR